MPEAVSRTQDFSRTTLRAWHRPVVRSLAEALFSAGDTIPPARLDAFVLDVDHFISQASKTLRFALLVMLEVVRWSPLFVIRRWSTFEGLPLPHKIRALEAMETSRVTLLATTLVAYKTLLTMIFFEDPSELRGLGYPGPERRRYKRGLLLRGSSSSPPGSPWRR